MLGQLKGGESRDSRWVGEEVEGEGLYLQMLLVWMLDLHRNVLERSAGVNAGAKVVVGRQMTRSLWEKGRSDRQKRGGGGEEEESKQLLTMALACLGLGCVPVQSKGTVCSFESVPTHSAAVTHCYLNYFYLNYASIEKSLETVYFTPSLNISFHVVSI